MVVGCASRVNAPAATRSIGAPVNGPSEIVVLDRLSHTIAAGYRPLVVAGKRGVFELDDRGAVKRRIGTVTDARAPRFLPGHRAIVLVQAATRLVELDLVTGRDRVVAGPWQPWFDCPGGDYVGESTVRFVRAGVLVLDDLLFLLEEGYVADIEGDLAR